MEEEGRGIALHLERVRGELPPILPRHGPFALRSPLLRYSFLPLHFSPLLLVLQSLSLSGTTAPEGSEGEAFRLLFREQFKSQSKTRGAHTPSPLSLSLFFASFVVVVFPFLTAPVFAAVLVQVSWGSTNQEKVESLKRRITADLATV